MAKIINPEIVDNLNNELKDECKDLLAYMREGKWDIVCNLRSAIRVNREKLNATATTDLIAKVAYWSGMTKNLIGAIRAAQDSNILSRDEYINHPVNDGAFERLATLKRATSGVKIHLMDTVAENSIPVAVVTKFKALWLEKTGDGEDVPLNDSTKKAIEKLWLEAIAKVEEDKEKAKAGNKAVKANTLLDGVEDVPNQNPNDVNESSDINAYREENERLKARIAELEAELAERDAIIAKFNGKAVTA